MGRTKYTLLFYGKISEIQKRRCLTSNDNLLGSVIEVTLKVTFCSVWKPQSSAKEDLNI